jgi:hypothetical protein
MKKVLSTVLGASLMSVGLVAVSATDAFASQSCDVNNIFSDIATYTGCEGAFSGNDDENEVNNIFKDVYDSNTSVSFSDKLDASSGSTDWFKITNKNNDKNNGQIEFLKDVNYKFGFVLKASNSWSSYFFDGITKGTVLDFDTAGVSQNRRGVAQDLSHATMYVSDIEVALRDEKNKPPKVYVPEPSAVLGLAFLGGGMFLSRRRKSS